MKRLPVSKIFHKKMAIRSLFIPSLVLVIGILIAGYAEQEERKFQSELVMHTLKDDVRKIRSDFEERITFYSYGLTGLHGLITTIGLENFDYQKMITYSKNRNFQKEFPGVRGIGFIQRVEQTEVDEFLIAQREMRPSAEFNLRQLSAHNESLFIIRYIEPQKNNESAVGLDIGSEAMRRQAAISAARSNEFKITAPITLVQADEKAKQGFLILMPVYDVSIIPEQPNEKLQHLIGWTYAPILIDEVLSSNSNFPNDVSLTISDVSEQSDNLFYEIHSGSSLDSTLVYSERVSVFGREWQFTVTAKNAYIDRIQTTPVYFTFFQYLIVTILIALFILSALLIGIRKNERRAHQDELQKSKEKTLKEANAQLESLVEKRTKEISNVSALQTAILQNANYAVITTDTSGLITLFNPAAEEMLGYAAKDLVLRQTPGLFHLESEIQERAVIVAEELGCEIKHPLEVFFAKAKRNIVDSSTWTYVTKNGTHMPVMLNLAALRNECNEITGYLGIAYDLSEQLQKEDALAEAKDIAEKANIAKSQLLANMSHEIRTPLNGIYGTLQLLQEEPDEQEKLKLVQIAAKSTITLNKLVNDILDFSKFEAGKLELDNIPVDLPELLIAIESELASSIEQKGLNFNVYNELTHDVWKTDDLRLKQIFLNILTNAIKFTNSGEINLSVSNRDTKSIAIVLTDTGIGMSDIALQRLFHRFEQADKSTTRRYGGTGLGMSITHSLVTLMAGEIAVSSTENIGTTVTISLPLEAIDSPELLKSTTSESIEYLTGKTVLIAEDNDINQIVLGAMLETANMIIYTVENGKMAVEFATTKHVDIVLMDINMPVMDGMEACKLIKSSKPDLPIVAITANVFQDDLALYEKVGFEACVAKPFDKEKLLSTMCSTLKVLT